MSNHVASLRTGQTFATSDEVARPTLGRVYFLEDCRRCGGAGGFQGWPGFTCYECGGQGRCRINGRTQMEYSHRDYIFPTGTTEQAVTEFRAMKQAEADARHEAKIAKMRAAKAAQMADLATSNPEFAAVLARYQAGEFRTPSTGSDDWTDSDRLAYFIDCVMQQVAPLSSDDISTTLRSARRIDAATARKVEKSTHEFVGEVGSKVTVSGEVVFTKWIDSNYGSSKLIIVKHETGTVKMFTTAGSLVEVAKGDRVTIAATVKAHEVYDGAKTTVLVRPKALEVLTNTNESV